MDGVINEGAMKILLWVGLFAGVRVGSAQRPAVNLVTHNRIVIARPAAAVWPFIVEPNSWKMGAKLVHRSGSSGQVGEVFSAAEANAPFLVENVELVVDRRRTIKLYQADGALIGYATWTLDENGGKTTVGYDVYAESLIPAGSGTTADARAEAERAERKANIKRFDAELAALKGLVER